MMRWIQYPMMAKSFQRLVLCGMACLCTGKTLGIEPEDLLHYKIGNWHFRPHASTSLTANDNIFFRDSSAESEALVGPKEGDVITQVGTGFQAALGRNDINTFGFGYDYLHRFYTDHSEVSSGDHAGQVAASIERGKVRFSTAHSVSLQTGIQGGNAQFVEQNDRFIFSDQIRVSVDITPKSDLYLSGTYGMTKQVDSIQFNDIESWNVAGGYGFGYSEKLRFFAQTSYGEQISSLRGSSVGWDNLGVSVGAEGEFTDKLTGTVQLGYQQQTSQMTGNGGGTPTVTLELEQLLGRRTLLTLAYTRRNQVNIDAMSAASVSDSFRLNLSRALGNRQKWFASIFASLWQNDFPDIDRSDQALSLGASLDYRIQEWMSSQLSYSYADFSAQLPGWALGGIDYQVNQVSLSLSFGF